MDDKVRDAIDNLADASPDRPQCPDCGEPMTPGHLCRESMEREVMLVRASFQTAIVALAKIRNATMVWKRGSETEKIKEVSGIAKKALADIQELLYKPKEELGGDNDVDSGSPGSVPDVPHDSV